MPAVLETEMRAGIFQCNAGGLSPDERVEVLAGRLAGNDLDLVVCPELFLSGYNVGEALQVRAEPTDGPHIRRLSDLARMTRTALVFGYAERYGDQLYNSAACLSSAGELIANHRKLLLPPGSEARYFQPGKGLTLFDLGEFRCGIAICFDAEFPETVRALSVAGAHVIFVPTALAQKWDVVAHKVMPARAFENGSWLLYANHAGEENGLSYLGASCIIAPDGRDAARAGSSEILISASLDIEAVEQARLTLPYLAETASLLPRLAHDS